MAAWLSALPGAQVAQVIGGWHLRRLLGSGGMANVFLAEDTLYRRLVALKVMSHELEGDSEFRARFMREARVGMDLHHPNIVRLHAAGVLFEDSTVGHLDIAPDASSTRGE